MIEVRETGTFSEWLSGLRDARAKAEVARREDVRLMTIRVQGGESSLQDLRQAEQSLYEVTQNIPTIRQRVC